jgi:glyceraldehyde 3-phosphate dehydrogenase
MKPTRIGINGFGRIGRAFFRAIQGRTDIKVVAINDLAPTDNLAYLLKYDTVYGRASFPVSSEGDTLFAGTSEIPVTHEKDPTQIPWGQAEVDIVVEATGVFASYEKAKMHLSSGAKRVVVSAPVKDDPNVSGVSGATVLMGVNEEKLGVCDVTSNASCTTNAASPLIGVLSEAIGIEHAILNTVHAYTASQAIVDAPAADDYRRGRAGAANMAPSSTGAAKATSLAHTLLKEKFDGIAVRVPVASGSLVDVTFVASKSTTAEEVNEAMRQAAQTARWRQVFATTDEPLVSSDIIGQPYGAIADLSLTRVVGGTLVKVMAWYDNEMGYAHTLAAHVATVGARIKNSA